MMRKYQIYLICSYIFQMMERAFSPSLSKSALECRAPYLEGFKCLPPSPRKTEKKYFNHLNIWLLTIYIYTTCFVIF